VLHHWANEAGWQRDYYI